LAFAVNVDPMEGRTESMVLEDFGSLGVPLKHAETDPDQAAELARLEARSKLVSESEQRFWRWCLAGGLVLLLLETGMSTWVSARRLRSEAAVAA